MKRILLFIAYLLIFSAIDNSLTLIFSDSPVYCAEYKNTTPTPQSPPNKTSLPIEQTITANSSKHDNSLEKK